MKLKRLEISGFKSFPEKTSIDFCNGVTSVVGPNGSGKSNIIEAIRWVMGEQRTRALRCRKMEDLIFNGSDSLKPRGMAEVRLTLDNDGKSFPPPMSDYDEIMVTRRVFRDGNSEYEINGVTCRLTDIVDFFLDTGIGRNSYAIIEQGRVEQIIAAKPEERRIFLEEAASINRYKARRESAIKKLEQTNENLQRIKDVVSEVKKQSASLRKQAVKAEQYKELKNRLRSFEIDLEALKCKSIITKLQQLKEDEAKLHDELTDKKTRLTTITASLESVRLRISDVQISFSNLLEELRSKEVELNSSESDLTNYVSREMEVLERQRRVKVDLDSLLQSKLLTETKLKEKELRYSEFITNESQLADHLQKSQSLIASLEKEAKDQNKNLEQLKQDLFGSLQKLSQSKNMAEQNLKRQGELKARLNKFEIDIVAQSEALQKLLKQIELVEDKNLINKNSLAEIEFRIEGHRKNNSVIVSEIKLHRENLRSTEEEFVSLRTRLESLSEESRNYSSYSSGTQFVMKTFSSSQNQEVLEPIAEIIQCPPEYHLALTSVLDSQLGAIIVKDFSRALEFAERMQKEEGVSRVGFISLDSFFENDPQPSNNHFQHLKRLSDVVVVEPSFEGLVNELLKDFYVVENLTSVKASFGNWIPKIKIVTLNGEIIIPNRLVSVGPIETMGKDVLPRKLEIESLFIKVSEIEHRIVDLKNVVNDRESQLQELSRIIEQDTQRKSDLRIEQARTIKDRERLKSENSRLMGLIRSIELDQKRTLDELNQLVQEQDELRVQFDILEKDKLSRTNKKEGLEKHVHELTMALRRENESLNEIRINLVKIEERKKSLEKDLNSTRNFIKNCARQISNLQKETEYLSRQAGHLSEEKVKTANRKQQLTRSFEKLRFERAKTQELFDSLQRDAVRLSEEELSINKVVGKVKDQLHQTELAIARSEETLKNSVEKISEKYHVDPRLVENTSIIPDEKELTRIRSKIESLGEVNLAAISESQQVESRLSFLLGQENDLNAAVKSLFSTIEKIDRTTAQRFHTTFQEVNLKFREIFSSLFSGGQAWLELIGSENSPDHGVNIMVKPPGKRLQNMDLLSGGEKALTAIAFIFAIFLYRPSSFCVLDEVDAPLDDSNVDRFNQMLKDLSLNTQFVVITHNKKSMENSDCLFGVTSEGSGASTLVSVKFSQ